MITVTYQSLGKLNNYLRNLIQTRSNNWEQIKLVFKQLVLLYYYIIIFKKINRRFIPLFDSIHQNLTDCLTYLLSHSQLKDYNINELIAKLEELKKEDSSYKLEHVIPILRNKYNLKSIVIDSILFESGNKPALSSVYSKDEDELTILENKPENNIKLLKGTLKPEDKPVVSNILPFGFRPPRHGFPLSPRGLTVTTVSPTSPILSKRVVLSLDPLVGVLSEPSSIVNVAPLPVAVSPVLSSRGLLGNPGVPQRIYKHGVPYDLVGERHHEKYIKYKTKYLELKAKLNL